jgi:hypothetical protein
MLQHRDHRNYNQACDRLYTSHFLFHHRDHRI